MRIKPSELNMTMPPMRKAQLIAEVNTALEVLERVDEQLIHWSKTSNPNLMLVNLMVDELLYIKKGKL